MRKHIGITAAARAALVVATVVAGGCGRSASSTSDSSAGDRDRTSASKVMAAPAPAMAPGIAGGVASMNGADVGVMPAMSPAPPRDPAEVASKLAAAPANGASTSAALPGLALGGELPGGSDPAGAMLVRHGEASVEVRAVDAGVARVRQSAAQFGGFVANTAVRGGRDEQRSARLEVRVPTEQFDALVQSLSALGKVETVNATAQDVGEEYVDIKAREVNARRVEARLTEMLASRTGKLSDVLTVEQELARVREEIERYDGRLRYLEHRASLSTLDIALHEPLPFLDRPKSNPLADAFALAWERAIGMLAVVIASMGVIVPLSLLVTGLVVIWRRRGRRASPAQVKVREG